MIDLSGAYALEDLIKRAKSDNIKIFVANAKSDIKEILEKVNFIKQIGENCYKDSKASLIPIISEYYNLKES